MSIFKTYYYTDAPLLPINDEDPVEIKIKTIDIKAQIDQYSITLSVRVDDVVVGCFALIHYFNVKTAISVLQDELYKNKNRNFSNSEQTAITNFIVNNIGHNNIKNCTPISKFPLEVRSINGIYDLALNPVTQRANTIYSIVTELNDLYRWSRERIADWLDTLDNCPRIV